MDDIFSKQLLGDSTIVIDSPIGAGTARGEEEHREMIAIRKEAEAGLEERKFEKQIDEAVNIMMPQSKEETLEKKEDDLKTLEPEVVSTERVFRSFEDLKEVKEQFPVNPVNDIGKIKAESAPQSLGAAVAKQNERKIPYPIHSQINILNEGLNDSKERLERIIRDNGPKKGIEHYKEKINFYEEEIKKAEGAKARYLDSIQKSASKKSEIEKTPIVKSEHQENVVQKNQGEQSIKQEIGEQLNLINSNEKPIREVDNTPKFDAFKKTTLKDLAGVSEPKDDVIPNTSNLEDGEISDFLKGIPLNQEGDATLTKEENTSVPIESFDKGWYGKAEELEMHKFNQAISQFEDTTEKKIETKGNWVMERARSTGEWYKKQSFTRKILISGVLIATASASALIGGPVAGTIATAAFTGTIAQRALGGLATFVATEAWLKRSAEKGGVERTKAEEVRHTIEAAVLGMLVGSGYAAEGIKTISDATGLTTLITDAYNYWLPPEDVAKITSAIKAPFTETSATPPVTSEVSGIKLDISDNLDMPTPETPTLEVDTMLSTTPDIAPEINVDTGAGALDSSLANTAEETAKAVAERGLTSDFSIELGKNGVPGSLEKVFHMMAANQMDLNGVAIFGEADGAKSLNIAANLVKLAEGHNLADVDNIAGISASDFNNAVTWDKASNVLTIKDHGLFNKITGNLSSRADVLWDQGVLQKGATAYLNDIKPESWVETLHADPLDKIGNIETGITGHDDIIPSQITDFDNSEMVKSADEAQRKIAERLDALRNELQNPQPFEGETYTATGTDKNTSSGSGEWANTKEALSATTENTAEHITPTKVPAKDALQSLTNYNVNKIMGNDINKLFGSKGFFGFGAKNGLESAEWLKAKDLPATKASGALKNYLENLTAHTSAVPQANETTESYIKRAIAFFIKDDGLIKTPTAPTIPVENITPEVSISPPTEAVSTPTPTPTPPSVTITGETPLPPEAPLSTPTPEVNITPAPIENDIPSVGIRGASPIPHAPLPQGNDGVIRFGVNNQ